MAANKRFGSVGGALSIFVAWRHQLTKLCEKNGEQLGSIHLCDMIARDLSKPDGRHLSDSTIPVSPTRKGGGMMTEKPIMRALTVFRSVALFGPVSLTRLTELHPDISRAAIWRALDNLRKAGWLRDRLGDKAWLITHLADDLLGNAQIPPRAVEEVIATLANVPKGSRVCVGTFTEIGRFEIVESTDADRLGEVLSLIGDPMGFSAVAASDPADMLRHLKRWMNKSAAPEERALITSGGLNDGLKRARQGLNPLRFDCGLVPLRSADGSVAVARIGPVDS